MVTYLRGDILQSDADCIVIPVNCVKTMGAGLAVCAARKWPKVEEFYLESDLLPGGCLFSSTEPGEPKPVIALLATKYHWKNDSEYDWIASGMEGLLKGIQSFKDLGIINIQSVAIPPLGCGLGKLDWRVVEAIVLGFVENLDLDVRIYPPREQMDRETYYKLKRA